MKQTLFCMLSVSLALFATGCIQLPTPFERIRDDKPRLLDFIYEPAEASPGDTVTLRALFAGRTLSPGDITWRFSGTVLKNLAGVDTAYDAEPLDGTVDSCTFSEKTSCFSLRFVVPENCIAQSPMVRENISAVFSGTNDGSTLPDGLSPSSLDATLAMIDFESRVVAAADSSELYKMSQDSMLKPLIKQLPLFSSLLTVPVRLFADVAGEHLIESDYSVSYTPRFARLPGSGLYVNHNPVIDSVIVYKVKGANVLAYNRDGDGIERFRLFGEHDDATTIPIDAGYSYFVEAAAQGRDTVVTIGDISTGTSTTKLEDFNADWMFQLDDTETASFSNNELLGISALGDLDAALAPPQKEQIRHFTLWVQVTDSKLGVLNRSQGSTVVEVRGIFSYTEAYLNQFRKK